MSKLSQKTCAACTEGVPPLEGKAIEEYCAQLNPGWHAIHEHHLEKEFSFQDFKEALAFTNRVGELAEQEHHHPDIHLSWGKVRIVLWTHKINGLCESDFVLAAKIDQIG